MNSAFGVWKGCDYLKVAQAHMVSMDIVAQIFWWLVFQHHIFKSCHSNPHFQDCVNEHCNGQSAAKPEFKP